MLNACNVQKVSTVEELKKASTDSTQIIKVKLDKANDKQQLLSERLNKMSKNLDKTKKQVNKIKSKNEFSLIDKLFEPLQFIEKRLKEEQKLFLAFQGKADEDDLSEMNSRLERLETRLNRLASSAELSRGLDIQIDANSLFNSGQFLLSNKGESFLNIVVEEIESSLKRYRNVVNDANADIILLMKVNGYADEQAFYYNQPITERKKENKAISHQRALSVGRYLEGSLYELVDKIEVKTEGKGEDLPPKVKKSNTNDPKRRICTLSVLIFTLEG